MNSPSTQPALGDQIILQLSIENDLGFSLNLQTLPFNINATTVSIDPSNSQLNGVSISGKLGFIIGDGFYFSTIEGGGSDLQLASQPEILIPSSPTPLQTVANLLVNKVNVVSEDLFGLALSQILSNVNNPTELQFFTSSNFGSSFI